MNTELTFEDWFGILQNHVLDRTGVNFMDESAVREDYDNGRDVYDVIDEIADEYGEVK